MVRVRAHDREYAAFRRLETCICLHQAARASQGKANFSNNDRAIVIDEAHRLNRNCQPPKSQSARRDRVATRIAARDAAPLDPIFTHFYQKTA